eukprot:7099623-Pyramimonas_sp.AAC.1
MALIAWSAVPADSTPAAASARRSSPSCDAVANNCFKYSTEANSSGESCRPATKYSNWLALAFETTKLMSTRRFRSHRNGASRDFQPARTL